MPVTVVVGGQFGSEGKGKVAHYFARERKARYAVRVGGSNSGHTVINDRGERIAFRQLPTAAILPDTICVIGPGSYIDVNVLLGEIDRIRLPRDRLIIDPNAVIITERNKQVEKKSGLVEDMGSTGSGTGSAVIDRIQRSGNAVFAHQELSLRPYCKCAQRTSAALRSALDHDEWIVVEGTQGFGLSILHSNEYPHVTSRDTSAAGFIAEAGLSPLDVKEIVLVIRTFPIRVAGNSGNLPNEIDWATLSSECGADRDIVEFTTVTQKIRRVARFDATIVRSAICVNNPTHLVLNHVDYLDQNFPKTHMISLNTQAFLEGVEAGINRRINLLGFGPESLISRRRALGEVA